jgi:hypothetical protein
VLAASGVKLEDLTDSERAQVLDALSQMSGQAGAKTTPASASESSGRNSNSPLDKKSSATKKPSRGAGSQKEIVIEIAVLKGKGYPPPTDLDTGSGKTKIAASK